MSSARRDERSSDSGSSSRVRCRVTYSEKNISVAVTKVTRLSKWQENLNAKWNDYASTSVPKHVTVHRERVGNKAKGTVVVKFLEPYRG